MTRRSLVIAVPTFRRAERLDLLLPILQRQAATTSGALGADISVLVIDNDPDASAQQTAQKHAVTYEQEPAPGLSAVRNRALEAAGAADALVFIDDDETPSDGWLENLVNRWRTSGADAVSGRVQTRFPDGWRDPWIEAGGFFRRAVFADGARQPVAPTNNLLLDLGTVRALRLRFDPRFGMSGGEDIMFTSLLTRAGGWISSCPAALVYDDVDAGRLTRRWVLRRAYRVGVTTVHVAVVLAPSPLPTRIAWIARGVTRMAGGGARRVVGIALRSDEHSARGARLFWRGTGMVAGALGLGYQEYARRG